MTLHSPVPICSRKNSISIQSSDSLTMLLGGLCRTTPSSSVMHTSPHDPSSSCYNKTGAASLCTATPDLPEADMERGPIVSTLAPTMSMWRSRCASPPSSPIEQPTRTRPTNRAAPERTAIFVFFMNFSCAMICPQGRGYAKAGADAQGAVPPICWERKKFGKIANLTYRSR